MNIAAIRPTRTLARAWAAAVLAWLLASMAVALWPAGAAAGTVQAPWRLMVKEAATVSGERVLLGEIAEPVGELDPRHFADMAKKELWLSPPENSQPMVVSRRKLYPALRHFLGEMAALCILPDRLALQRGGKAVSGDDLRKLVVNTLTPMAGAMDGEAELRDFRLPDFMFLANPDSEAVVELASQFTPGRLSVRFTERGPSGDEGRKLTGTLFLDLWKEVPAAARPVNPGEALGPAEVTFMRKNLAYLREDVWDGRGGPWRVKRPIGQEQVIYKSSLEALPAVSKGDTVQLVYRGTAIQLRVPAEALDDGSPGESIEVRNLQSDRKIFARVLDSRTVQVQ